ncbi:dynamin-related protein 4C-like [Senna tora]|uniref:Dynamin-related protein 4C-like n=1 Tax=Senna tora TaxID=362788 RepID=A0A834TFJ0_9FABA|nr:dynamin-related protein 4C-like [Senna tora]
MASIALNMIWDERNRKKFTKHRQDMSRLWLRAAAAWDEIVDMTVMNSEHVSWTKSEPSWTKMNTDARTCSGGVIGGLVRDSFGACMADFVEPKSFPQDPILLEAMAIFRGMEVACEAGVRILVVETDSKPRMRHVYGVWRRRGHRGGFNDREEERGRGGGDGEDLVADRDSNDEDGGEEVLVTTLWRIQEAAVVIEDDPNVGSGEGFENIDNQNELYSFGALSRNPLSQTHIRFPKPFLWFVVLTAATASGDGERRLRRRVVLTAATCKYATTLALALALLSVVRGALSFVFCVCVCVHSDACSEETNTPISPSRILCSLCFLWPRVLSLTMFPSKAGEISSGSSIPHLLLLYSLSTILLSFPLRQHRHVINQAFDLKMRMVAYWKIVLRRLVDTIALHMQLSISNLVNKELEKEISHEVLSPNQFGIERLLEESPSVAGKRHKLMRSVKVLKESKEVVTNIMDIISS